MPTNTVLKGLVALACGTLTASAASNISGVWANNGEDKVTQEQLRASNGQSVTNFVWDGTRINQFGARNEVVEFSLILEAKTSPATNVSVTISSLTGPGGALLRSALRGTNDLFNWTGTEVELFYVRYLPILGTSGFGYEGGQAGWAEAVFPSRLQCPGMTQPGGPDSIPSGTGCDWTSRPGANKNFPDIAVPLELVPAFTIAQGNNQAVWVDVYIPKTAPAGNFTGSVFISENGTITHTVPVNLTVRNFTLPEVPNSKTMLDVEYGDASLRYTGVQWPNPGSPEDLQTLAVLGNQMRLAHRHKVSLIDDNFGQGWNLDRPAAAWLPFLSGAGFTATNGYAGPGTGVGNDVFSVGTYGGWQGEWGTTSNAIVSHCNAWESWFAANSPGTERFLYLIDESPNYAQTEQWAKWMKSSSGAGSNLHSLATVPLVVTGPYTGQPRSYTNITTLIPDLDIPTCTGAFAGGPTNLFQAVADLLHTPGSNRRVFYYNPSRPGAGHLAIVEDDGVSPREAAWAMFKKGVDRLFYWEGTYYNDFQGGRGNNHLYTEATTFGGIRNITNSAYGLLSSDDRTSNGDGVLLFPGTDAVYNEIPYHVPGPFAGLCLKVWRRGIQDVDYLALAKAINPAAVSNLLAQIVPMALWEVPPHDPIYDPTYTYRPITWTNNPDVWESARLQLANIIERPLLSLQAAGNNLVLTWTADNSLLLEASNLEGPWTTNLGAASPLTVTPTNAQRFYRLLVP